MVHDIATGGVGSVLGGGKFANGAITGAFSRLFNDMAVIENGPTEGNPVDHTAAAITDEGAFSFDNHTPAGSILRQFAPY